MAQSSRLTAVDSDGDRDTAPEVPSSVHLRVFREPEPSSSRWRRLSAAALALTAAGLLVFAFFRPWWSFTLYAPQYPKGLRLDVSLIGVAGDVSEVDTLNHYIGMASLSHAAPLERSLAGWGVALLASLTVVWFLFAGRKLGRLSFAFALALPLGFLADSMYWLYRFGHNLDPRAPLDLPPFTPQMFGNGEIGQFMTFAQPLSGFWAAGAGALLVTLAVLLRERTCRECRKRFVCRSICTSGFVGPALKPLARSGVRA
jgi:copper chaperone NosL